MWQTWQTPTPWIVTGALLGAMAVAAGAYGWHALEGDAAMRDIFMLAVQYHMWHALALLAVGWRCSAGLPGARWAALGGIAFVAGIVLFSFNLYAFARTGEVVVAGAAPIGGFCLIAGWILLAVSALARKG